MKIDMNGVIYSLSFALDCIEAELVGITEEHSKWVAYLSTLLGRAQGYSYEALADLAACAALHDNALTQYLAEEQSTDEQVFLGGHSKMGEKNISNFPFHGDTAGFIKYHHENADGSGPFGMKSTEIPIQAHIIHLADMLDVTCHLKNISKDNYLRMQAFLNQQEDVMFDRALVEKFYQVLPLEKYLQLEDRKIDDLLSEELPHKIEEYSFKQVQAVMDVYGRIVDYKSTFTRNHSDHIAEKLFVMANYYGYEEDTIERLYVAGVLHDIGKMAIKNEVLEKPDKLSTMEFAHMQNYAWFTYKTLKGINGFEDITEWAALHHEKLNGKGYPFGKTAEELSQIDRLMGCVDIYQALSENRPYKAGMDHKKCIAIMRDMAEQGFIDADIVNDIDLVFLNK